MTLTHRLILLVAALFLVPAATQAQSRLPVAEGVYAQVGAPCASGWLWVYSGERAGYLSFYGPNQSMGPDLSQVEHIQSVGSGHDGFTAINDAGVEVRAAGEGQIIVRAYSLAQGPMGSTRFRRCDVLSLHPRMRVAVAQLGYSEGAAGRGNTSARTNSGAAWRVSRRPDGIATAGINAAAGLPELTVTCRSDVAYLNLKTSTAERGRGPRSIEFVGGTTGLRRTEIFQRDPQTGDWSTGAGSETVALLSGRDTQVELKENGRSIGTLSLIGSTAALGQALDACPTQGVTGGFTAAPSAEARTAAPLNILAGYYVTEDRSCSNPFDIFYFDGRRFGYYVESNQFDDVWPVVSAELGQDFLGRDGWVLRGTSERSEMHVRVLAPNRVHLISGPPMRWCPEDQVPLAGRVSGLGEEPGEITGTVRQFAAPGAAPTAAAPFSGTSAARMVESGVGSWQGTYNCSQGATGVRLAIRTLGRNSPQREATFTFYEVGGRAEQPQGSFVLRGTIRGERLVLEPQQWLQRYRNYAMVGLDGEIRGDTYAGRVTGSPGCTTFSVRSMIEHF